MAGDIIQKNIGDFGKYQLRLCLIIFVSKVFVAFHQMAIIFLAPKITHTCPPSTVVMACPCDKPEYDTTIFKKTITTQWHLICERKWLASFTQLIFQFGVLLGSVLFGMAADRFGRKNPLLVAVVLEVVTGIGAAHITEYWTFTFVRFILGMSVGGTMVTSFVIILEFVGAKYREIVSSLYHVPFNLGHIILPLFGYIFRDYTEFLFSISIPSLVLLSYFVPNLVPETPRWLIAVHRNEEAIAILERAAIMNDLPTTDIRTDVDAYQASLRQNEVKNRNILDLFRTPNIRKNIIAMALNWLACSYCFYGMSQFIGHVGGNPFINVASSASVTFMGSLAAIPLMKVFGRKTLLIMFHFICSGCLIILALLPEGPASVLMACIGTVSSFIVFVVVYLYCTELFPTVVRNAALGFCSMSARVGSMIAPFVIDLHSVALWMPPIGFAILPLIGGCVTFLLPETKGCELMTTIEQGEQFGKNKE